uniref:Variant surface glycoprotein 511 n=1 Tax=Trypanosoma brucei TaxID=5691 RepID=M4TDD9_9TRYP|nr:variant surface glycoprotein 511 [Trypanosoma brucei]
MSEIRLLFALLLLHGLTNVQANSAAKDNAAEFAALCGLINLAQHAPKPPSRVEQIDTIARTIVAINLTVGDPKFAKLIDKTKTKENFNAITGAPKEGVEFVKWQKNYATWAAAKREIEDGEHAAEYRRWQSTKLRTSAIRHIQQSAELAVRLQKQGNLAKSRLKNTKIQDNLNTAQYGSATNTEPENHGSNTRAQTCGTTGSEPQNKACAYLMLDVLCLCGHLDGDGNAHKVCGPLLDTTQANEVNWAPNAGGKKTWQAAKAACKATDTGETISGHALHARMTELLKMLDRNRQATTGRKKHVLGSAAADLSTGCTGNAAGQAGRCLIYKDELFADGHIKIPWYTALKAAADEADSMAVAESTVQTINQQLASLNVTTAALIYDTEINTPTNNDKAPTIAPQEQVKEKRDAAEKVCNAAGDDQKECANLKEKGCVYKKDGEANKKCTLSEAGKQAAEKANQEGKDGKTVTTNTTGRNSFVINKAPLLLAVLFLA